MASNEGESKPAKLHLGFRNSMRLNHNHWIFKELAGYLIHPSIPTKSPELRIADVGTGTNIWALEAVAQLSDTARVDGFDISAKKFVSSTSRPSNLYLHVHDCLKPFPAEFMSSFDVVHARLWICFVDNSEALHLLRNLISLLKPGGYLQWFEPLPLSAKAMHPMPESIDPAVERVVTYWTKQKPTSTSEWVERLPEAFGKEGLELVAVDRMPLPERYRHFWGQAQMAGLEAWAGDKRSEALEQWLVQLEEAFANGTFLDTEFLCVVGRKGQ